MSRYDATFDELRRLLAYDEIVTPEGKSMRTIRQLHGGVRMLDEHINDGANQKSIRDDALSIAVHAIRIAVDGAPID